MEQPKQNRLTLNRKEKHGKYYFDTKAADLAVQFFPGMLTHVTGKKWAGKPFKLLSRSRIARTHLALKTKAKIAR